MARRVKKKAGSSGTVFQRGDGIWVSQVTIGTDEHGKRIRQTLYSKTEEEAEQKLILLKGGYGNGIVSDPTSITVGAYLIRWIEDSKTTGRLRETTYWNYKRLIDKHLLPYIGGSLLSKLTEPQLRSYLAALEQKGVSVTVQNSAYRVLHRALNRAVEVKALIENPLAGIEAPVPPTREMSTFTPEQVIDFLATARESRFESIFYLAICGGLRLGECIGLQWKDVNWEKGSIAVQRQVVEIGPKKIPRLTTELKSESSRRVVLLPAIAMAALKRHKERMDERHYAGPQVFVDSEFRLLRQANFESQHYKPLLKKAGVPQIRFHDLRHSHATLLLLLDTHPKVVQERLGHESIEISLDLYSHVMPTIQKSAVDKMNEFFGIKVAESTNTLSGAPDEETK